MKEEFEKLVIKWITLRDRSFNLWWMGDFYDEACKILKLDFEQIEKNQAKMRRHLDALVKKGVIKKYRAGTGFLGKTDFNSTSFNVYINPDYLS
jgi:hypothetical protein